jgi:hypothetical protein
MFDSVDEMVEENDRRHLDEDLEPEDRDQSTPEYIFFSPRNLYDSLMESSQERLYRGYELLVRHIPNLKARLVDQDVLELSNYFRDVSSRPVQREICTQFKAA